MYQINRNNYHTKPKASNIQTPPEVSQFIFELLKDKIPSGVILDPCCGQRNLLEPWKEQDYRTLGIDNDKNLKGEIDFCGDFLNLEQGSEKSFSFYLLNEWRKYPPTLIICNPPFNGYKNKLGSELWLDKIIELFGKEVPTVLENMTKKRLQNKISKKLDTLQEILNKITEAQIINSDDSDTWDSDALYNLVEKLKEALKLLEDEEDPKLKDNFGEPLILEEGICSLVDEYFSEEEEF